MSGVLWARRSEKIWASVLSMREEPLRRLEKVAALRDRGDCCGEVVQSFSASSGDLLLLLLLPTESDRPLMGSILLVVIRLSMRIHFYSLCSQTSVALISRNTKDCVSGGSMRFAISSMHWVGLFVALDVFRRTSTYRCFLFYSADATHTKLMSFCLFRENTCLTTRMNRRRRRDRCR